MSYTITTPELGFQPIAVTDTTKNHPLGTIVTAKDPTYGTGEFVYLLGVTSTTVGSVVVWDTATFQTALAPVGNNLPQPVGFAMSANPGSSYGWYQISGVAVAAKTSALSLASNAAVGVKTTGKVATTGTGKEIEGAITQAKATTPTTVALVINRPHMQGRVT